MATQYMYNSMGVGRKPMLTKGEMDRKQYDIYINSIQDSRKNTEQRQIEYCMGRRTNKSMLPLLSL